MAVATAQQVDGGDPLLRVLADAETSVRRQRGDRPGRAEWPAEGMLPPLPAGRVVQAGVRCDFVDMRRAFVSLGRDELSGYVRLSSEGVHAAAMLSAGGVVAAVYEEAGAVLAGTEAFARMRRVVDSGQGMLEIVQLPEVVLGATRQMLVGPPVYQQLSGRFLRGAEFVDFMSEQTLTGGIQVRSGGRQGVVLLHDGVIGAYTSRSPKPAAALDEVMELFSDPTCEVSVNGGPVGATLPLMIL